MVRPEDDDGIVRIGTGIQCIQHPADLRVHIGNRGQIGMQHFTCGYIRVPDGIRIIDVDSQCVNLVGKELRRIGRIGDVVGKDGGERQIFRQWRLHPVIHVEVGPRCGPGQVRLGEAYAEKPGVAIHAAECACHTGILKLSDRQIGRLGVMKVRLGRITGSVHLAEATVRFERTIKRGHALLAPSPAIVLGLAVIAVIGHLGFPVIPVVDFPAEPRIVAVREEMVIQGRGGSEHRHFAPINKTVGPRVVGHDTGHDGGTRRATHRGLVVGIGKDRRALSQPVNIRCQHLIVTKAIDKITQVIDCDEKNVGLLPRLSREPLAENQQASTGDSI